MLLFDATLTASEARDSGLATAVYPHVALEAETADFARRAAAMPPQSALACKEAVTDREMLHAVNARECEVLEERWQSEECASAMISFLQKKKK